MQCEGTIPKNRPVTMNDDKKEIMKKTSNNSTKMASLLGLQNRRNEIAEKSMPKFPQKNGVFFGDNQGCVISAAKKARKQAYKQRTKIPETRKTEEFDRGIKKVQFSKFDDQKITAFKRGSKRHFHPAAIGYRFKT
jgi:hypothetical protein